MKQDADGSAPMLGSVANESLMQGMSRVSEEVASWSKEKCELLKEFLPVECLVDAKHDPVGPTSGDRIRSKPVSGSK